MKQEHMGDLLTSLGVLNERILRIAVAMELIAYEEPDLAWQSDDQGPPLSYGMPATTGQVKNRPLRSINDYWYCACRCVDCRNCTGYSDAVTVP